MSVVTGTTTPTLTVRPHDHPEPTEVTRLWVAYGVDAEGVELWGYEDAHGVYCAVCGEDCGTYVDPSPHGRTPTQEQEG